jgi:hypothetical protein
MPYILKVRGQLAGNRMFSQRANMRSRASSRQYWYEDATTEVRRFLMFVVTRFRKGDN